MAFNSIIAALESNAASGDRSAASLAAYIRGQSDKDTVTLARQHVNRFSAEYSEKTAALAASIIGEPVATKSQRDDFLKSIGKTPGAKTPNSFGWM